MESQVGYEQGKRVEFGEGGSAGDDIEEEDEEMADCEEKYVSAKGGDMLG